ncbi:MAG: hypothetical protein ACW990_17555 [Promethearchaeota archaeon]|jgi:hypothetical protein
MAWIDSPDFGNLDKKITHLYLVIAMCGTHTVKMFIDRQMAFDAKKFIDKFACGGKCHNSHYVIKLSKDAAKKMKVRCRNIDYKIENYCQWLIDNRPEEYLTDYEIKIQKQKDKFSAFFS